MVIFLLLFAQAEITLDRFVEVPPGMAVFGPENQIYLLDPDHHQINVFDLEWNLLMRFGSKGEGPGSFVQPHNLYVNQGKLYLRHDVSKTTLFSSQGTFVDQNIDMNNRGWGFWTQNHYVNLKWGISSPQPFELIYSTKTGESWESQIILEGHFPIENPKKPYYDPTWHAPIVLAKEDVCIFLSMGWPLKAWKISFNTGATKEIILTQPKKIPFNDEWAQSIFEDVKSKFPDANLVSREFFPPFKHAYLAPNHNIVLEHWTGIPGKTRDFKEYALGPEILPFPAELMERVVDFNEEWVLFNEIDEDSDLEVKLVLCRIDAFADEAKKRKFKVSERPPQKFVII